jgi:hypothetical protein
MSAFDPGVLESLVGVTFQIGSLTEYDYPADYATLDPLIGEVNLTDTPGYIVGTISDPAYVVSATSSYTAAYTDGFGYGHFSSFGSITLNFNGSNTVLYIYGASENGLFLSTIDKLSSAEIASGAGALFSLTNTPNPTFPLSFNNDAAAYVAPVCFAEGTRILTTRGEVAVEDLVEGDEAVTAGGAVRPVIWVGSRRMRCDRHPNPSAVHPVRVRAGAFADGVPSRDLRLSPGHAVNIDGVLVEISLLANGATIVSEPVDAIRYFHVELDAHDVILAEGLACESYLDDGNRETFGNAPGHLALYGRLDPVDWDQACLPIERHGPRTEALRARLRARAEDLGWCLTADPQFTLEADGQAVSPVFSTAQRAWFLVQAAQRLVLRSPASVPALTTPGHSDPRRLGVALSALRVGGEAIDLTSDALGQGFHALERQEADGVHRLWRWTDGAAELPATPTSTMIEIEVSMVSPRWVAPDQTLNQASPIAPRLRLVEAG